MLHSSSVPLENRLLAWLRRYADDNPAVTIEVSQASSETQALDIHEGRADLGLACEPILRRHGGVRHAPLHEEPLVGLVPADHALAGRTRIALAELRAERFVATPHLERGGLSHRVAELCAAAGFEPFPASVRSRKWTQLALVQGGFGVAVVPESMGRLAPEGVRVLRLGETCTTAVVALWRHDAPARVQRFAGALLHAMERTVSAPS